MNKYHSLVLLLVLCLLPLSCCKNSDYDKYFKLGDEWSKKAHVLAHEADSIEKTGDWQEAARRHHEAGDAYSEASHFYTLARGSIIH